ncbi:MAG TPA: FecR domain-containing protein [Methylomirabilota bacterium]|nr:FecR domain-containing protein [Methylomirabilota bacterium]
MDATRTVRIGLIAGTLALSWPFSALSQERVGVVTNLEGTATVVRAAPLQTQELRFKDDVYLHDRITTAEHSVVRVLLGGKATVTARERSVLTITEMPNVSTIELQSGRISVAVSKALMKPGESVEIKTPNTITAIRGTVVVAEVVQENGAARSNITLLRGLIDVKRLDQTTHAVVGRAVSLHPLQTVTASGSLLSAPKSITPEAARQLSAEFWIVPKSAPASSQEPAVRHAVRQAVLDAASHSALRDGKVEKAEKGDKGDKGDRKDKVSRKGDDSGPGSDSPGQSLDGLSQSKKLADGVSALDDKKIKDKLDDKIIKTKLDAADVAIPTPRLAETTVRPLKVEKPEKK